MAEVISIALGTYLFYLAIKWVVVKNIVDLLFNLFTSKLVLSTILLTLGLAFFFPDEVIPYLQIFFNWLVNSVIGLWDLLIQLLDKIVSSVVG